MQLQSGTSSRQQAASCYFMHLIPVSNTIVNAPIGPNWEQRVGWALQYPAAACWVNQLAFSAVALAPAGLRIHTQMHSLDQTVCLTTSSHSLQKVKRSPA
jgi:hypothetical protein